MMLTDPQGKKTQHYRILEIQLNVLEITSVETSTSKGFLYDGDWYSTWDTYLAKRIHDQFLYAAFDTIWIDESGQGDSVEINIDSTKSFEVKQVLVKNGYWEERQRMKNQYSDTFERKLTEKKIILSK